MITVVRAVSKKGSSEISLIKCIEVQSLVFVEDFLRLHHLWTSFLFSFLRLLRVITCNFSVRQATTCFETSDLPTAARENGSQRAKKMGCGDSAFYQVGLSLNPKLPSFA